jgi:hypothetical protein
MDTFPALAGGLLDEAQLGGDTVVGDSDPDWLGVDRVMEMRVVEG